MLSVIFFSPTFTMMHLCITQMDVLDAPFLIVCRKPEGDPDAITYGRELTQLLQDETGLTEATSDHQPKEGLRDFHGHVRFEILVLAYSIIPPFSHSFSLSSTHHLPFV